MRGLPINVRLEGRPVILLGEGDAATAKRRLLERAGARIVGEEGNAVLAVVAIGNEHEALDAIRRLKARGVLVNAVDRPDQCDFTLPAIVDRSPVTIAIATDGASAGLAKALRQRLELMLPQSLGALAEGLRSARDAMRQRWPDASGRRHAIDAALGQGGLLDPFRNASASLVGAWLDSPPEGSIVSGFFPFILESDDPDQLTLEQARLLGQADTVIHSPAISSEILARVRADTRRIESEETPSPLPDGLTVKLVRKTP